MARVKLKYELRVSPGLKLEEMVFEDKKIDFLQDQDPNDSVLFKNANAYYVYPADDQLRIKILANGLKGFEWTLKVWVNDKLITDPPIQMAANSMGRADYDSKINWR